MVPPGRLERPHPAPEAGALSAELWGPARCARTGAHPECITRLAPPQGRRGRSYAIVEWRAGVSAPASNGERGASMPDVHRIGVISDTHIPSRASRVPDAALRHFEDVELILHAGDLSVLAVLDQLAAFAPVEAVQGNVEQAGVVQVLPVKRQLVVGGCVIGLVPILREPPTFRRNARREF